MRLCFLGLNCKLVLTLDLKDWYILCLPQSTLKHWNCETSCGFLIPWSGHSSPARLVQILDGPRHSHKTNFNQTQKNSFQTCWTSVMVSGGGWNNCSSVTKKGLYSLAGQGRICAQGSVLHKYNYKDCPWLNPGLLLPDFATVWQDNARSGTGQQGVRLQCWPAARTGIKLDG